MSAKHTAAPWRVRPDAGDWHASNDAIGSSAYEAVLAGDEVVALVVAYGADPFGKAPPTEHNARLIAAAPDLLEALRRCKFDSLNMTLDDLAFCRAAYAKATGAQQ